MSAKSYVHAGLLVGASGSASGGYGWTVCTRNGKELASGITPWLHTSLSRAEDRAESIARERRAARETAVRDETKGGAS